MQLRVVINMQNELSEKIKQEIRNHYGNEFNQKFQESVFMFSSIGYTEEQAEELAWYSFFE